MLHLLVIHWCNMPTADTSDINLVHPKIPRAQRRKSYHNLHAVFNRRIQTQSHTKCQNVFSRCRDLFNCTLTQCNYGGHIVLMTSSKALPKHVEIKYINWDIRANDTLNPVLIDVWIQNEWIIHIWKNKLFLSTRMILKWTSAMLLLPWPGTVFHLRISTVLVSENKWYMDFNIWKRFVICLVRTRLGSWWRHRMETFSALLSFVRGIHRWPDKGHWRGALMFSLICARINGWENNVEAGDLRRHRAHYDVILMSYVF